MNNRKNIKKHPNVKKIRLDNHTRVKDFDLKKGKINPVYCGWFMGINSCHFLPYVASTHNPLKTKAYWGNACDTGNRY